MGDISGQFYRASKVREGTSPSSPGVIVGEPVNPVNPIGSGQSYLNLTDTNDSSYIGKDGFVPIVVGESGLTLVPLPQIQENGLISGGIVQWTGIGYIFNVSGAFYRIGGVLYESQPIQITLATPDVTNDRIDVFAVDINGVALAITGTPSGSPVKPQIDPQTQLELTSVIVTAASSVPTLTEEVIYDENVEWTGSSTGNGTVAFNSAIDPYQGSVSINATNIQNGLKIRLTDGSDYDLSTVQTLGMQINLKATMGAGLNIGVTFLDSSANPISTELILNHDKTLLGYQFVGIALNQFSFTSFLARSIEFRYIRTKGTIIYSGFFLDIIKLEGGINPPVGVGSFLGLSDTPKTYSGQAGKTVAVKADESGLEFVTGGGGASTFIGLSDTPANYTGSANKFPRVNGTPDALIFDTISPYDLDQEGASDGQVVTWVAANSRYEPTTVSGASNWTVGSGFIYRNGPVVVGDTTWSNNTSLTVKGNSTFASWVLKVQDSSGVDLISLLNDRRLWMYSQNIMLGDNPTSDFGINYKSTSSGTQAVLQFFNSTGTRIFRMNANGDLDLITPRLIVGSPSVPITTGSTFKGSVNNSSSIFQIRNSSEVAVFNFLGLGIAVFSYFRHAFGLTAGIIANGSHFQGNGTGTGEIFVVQNGSAARAFEIRGNRQIIMAGLPTTNPGVTGSLWNNAGVLNIA